MIREAVKECLKKWGRYIEHNKFDAFFELTQDNYTFRTNNQLCRMFRTAKIDFLPHMTFIPEGCFAYSDTIIKRVVISSNITKICFKSFQSSNIEEVLIPSSVIEIDEEAFMDCNDLTYVQIDNGCLYIRDNCFYACSNLKTVIIPNSVISFGTSLFHGCNKLERIQYDGGVEEWKKIHNSDHIADNMSSLKYIACGDGIINL